MNLLRNAVTETRRGIRFVRGGATLAARVFGAGSASGAPPEDTPDPASLRFPPGFLWGVATASHQVEGDLEDNDWFSFTSSRAIRERVRKLTGLVGRPTVLQSAGDAVRHGDLSVLAEDLNRAQALGLTAYRFSLEWSRLQPEPPSSSSPDERDFDAAGLNYYRQVLEMLRDRDLEPILTINHMTLPRWVLEPPRASSFLSAVGLPTAVPDATYEDSLRGWESEATVDAFREFVAQMVPLYKDLVDWWIPLNEPVGSMVGVGYIGGVWPPGFNLGGGFPAQAPFTQTRAEKAYFNLLRAHVEAYDTIKELDDIDADGDGRPSLVGVAHAMMHAVPALGPDPFGANAAATRQFDYFFNCHFLDALVGDVEDPAASVVDAALEAEPRWRVEVPANDFFEMPTAEWHSRLDFVGVNYYRRVHVSWDPVIELTTGFAGGRFTNDLHPEADRYGLLNDLGWEIYPGGLAAILERLHQRYRLPVLITENGLADSFGGNRAPVTVAHLAQLLRAIDAGADVRGYVHWSLLDNYEWHEGYRPEARFGLFRVDRDASDETGTHTLDRHITEAAFTLQYASALGGLEGAADRFGVVATGGDRVQPPASAHAQVFEGEVGGDPVTLHLRRLPSAASAQRWLGMLFFEDDRRWIRLEQLSWDDAKRKLRFSHPAPAGGPGWTYEAVETGGTLAGTARRGITQLAWQVSVQLPAGRWVSPTPVTMLELGRPEGDYGGWQGKLLEDAGPGPWRRVSDIAWDGQTLSFRVPDLLSFRGDVSGDTMQGALEHPRVIGTWAATRVPSGLPF